MFVGVDHDPLYTSTSPEVSTAMQKLVVGQDEALKSEVIASTRAGDVHEAPA
jgi:hypothetical protein